MLNFIELFAFSATGQDVAASAIGGVATQTSTYQSQVASYGNDLFCDPWIAGTNSWMAGGATGPSTWTVTFASVAPISSGV